MLPISIPVPCHENWDNMQPRNDGRHCSACAKTVVDFTVMSDEEVLHYLDTQKGRVCGRFSAVQLNRKTIVLAEDIYKIPMPLWKRFLAAGLIAFSTILFSCDAHVTGMPVYHNGLKNNADPVTKVCVKETYLLGDITTEGLQKDAILNVKPPLIKPDIPLIMGVIDMPVEADTANADNKGKSL